MTKKAFEEQLCKILVARKALSADEAIVLRQDFRDKKSKAERFEDFLEHTAGVERRLLLSALSECCQVPSYDVIGAMIDQALVSLFPQDILMRHVALPLEIEGDILTVVTSDPTSESIQAALGEYVDYEIQCLVGLHRDILDTIVDVFESSAFDDVQSDEFQDNSYEEDEFFSEDVIDTEE